VALSRRQVIRLGQAWLAAAALPRQVFGSDVQGPPASMSKASFEALIGTTFMANERPIAPTWLTLTSVEDLSIPSTPIRIGAATFKTPVATEAFALQFYGVGAPLTSDSHDFQHPTLGQVSLFVTPAGSQYIAVFNHLKGPLPPNIPSRSVKTAA
jgi:hypothetical protein